MKTVKLTALTLLFCTQVFASSSFVNDSLQNSSGSSTYEISHKVSSQETLYSLLKKYDCTSEDFYRLNSELNGKPNIYVNQSIKFPRKSSVISTRKAEDHLIKETVISVHTVRPSETLYSISKLYAVRIEELKRVNNLDANEIKIGQSLIIHSHDGVSSQISEYIVSTPSSFPDDLKPERFVVPNAPKGERISEIGIVEVIPTKSHSNKLLALHRTAPLGSLMTVKNEATGDRIMVKVIGKLPETGNNANILIRLSPSAFYKLNPKDIRIRAEIAYFLPPNVASLE